MDKLTGISSKLKVSTNEISAEIIQVVMVQAKKHTNSPKVIGKEWNEIAELLWKHLQTGLTKYDDQLLCATCFFSVLPLTENQDFYLTSILLVINKELDLRNMNYGEEKHNFKISEVVSVMYGLFQSAFLTQSSTEDLNCMDSILKSSFNLLLLLAYEYSRFTYIAFKTINSFKKIIGTTLHGHIFDTAGIILLLNLVIHNWENPITGVRDLNRGIFQMVISNLTRDMYEDIFKQINDFYWNKAKYLMLSEIIETYTYCLQYNIHDVINKSDWVDGLMYSLCKSGLVSAGADMYYAILKQLKSDDEWCGLFLNKLLQILTSQNIKAIENFTNYWCLTTFKKMPSLAKILIGELDVAENSENKIYSSLCLLKQANKLGLLQKDWSAPEVTFPKDLMLCAVDSCNTSLRIQAFDVVCVSQCKSMPQAVEYDVVLRYLQDNVTSDCTVLRLSMFDSLNSFLTRIQSTYMTNSNVYSNINFQVLISFCKKLQNFIVDSLSLNGNYQRKITTVKLCKLVQDCFCSPPRKMQKQGSRIKSLTICEMLKKECSWILHENVFVMKLLGLLNDPSDDIRENIIQLLLNHYYMKLKCPLILNHVIDNALNSMTSKFFYNINCGRSMFKLITNILLAEDSTAKFKNAEDVFLFAYQELVTENKLRTDVVKSIETGKQLHSLITILHVVLEACYQNTYKIARLDEHFAELVSILEEVSNQFAWEDTSTSSDFSKMSDMVEIMISLSGYDPDKDQTKISGLHQIVLNCLWLNVKVSCDLASLLIQFTEDIELINKCLNIIARVLETCRHKGAIEAAGAAIGKAIQHLTSLTEHSVLQQLPYTLLKHKLRDLISEAGGMSSITRRGAGLSIMVHRIVSSDMKRGKPLFHYFMETLLATCASIDSPESESTIDNQRDLPQAIYIHFLTRIVTDSSLASDMMYYSAKLAALAFGNLTSPRWQIRNAALQLYGALIPKLIGQKKASGSDDETVATVACDEFRTHSPALWCHITESLAAYSYKTEVQAHSDLVPILNILGNIAKRYNFTVDIEAQTSKDTGLLKSLILLLHSPIYTIRRLTAKCIFNLFSFDDIYDVIVKQNIKSENYLHGILMLLTIYHKKQCKHSQMENNYEVLKDKFENILNTGKHSYVCKQLFEEIFCSNVLDINDLHDTLLEMRNNAYSPGVHLWAENRIEKIVAKMPWSNIPEILETLLLHDCNKFGTFILRKLNFDESIPKSILLEISNQLLVFSQKWDNTVIWDMLYVISLKEKIVNVDVNAVLSQIKGNDVPYKIRFAIPFAIRVSTDHDNMKVISEILLNLSDPEINDTDMRYIAALANNEIAQDFEKLPDDIKINAITTAVILLQDEDEDIRNLNVQFYKNIRGGIATNPYICLHKILNHEFLDAILKNPKQGKQDLCEKLSKVFEMKSIDDDEYNPFANETKNIYCEVPVIRKFIEKLKSS
ncbi:uncharacterized protein LOC128674057 isoform X1 [Plodia interpunctella]|uniref:uncharacterized protein LOC128674057 isoform X1 n=1 Tax=Plodia interpunctella TaxID=58824 RepID=UPI0023681F86|nr:uncharacterized protein LOC128674057 isoform X1 [Plodia interpunctella]XP_053608315.1 uncharacterized protein LOC128674057 isoform X1 [Plodia interpunctella]